MAQAAKTAKRRVLVAVDGSKGANHAFQWYLDNMKQPDDYVFGIIVPQYKVSGVSVISIVGPLSDVEAIGQEFKSQHEVVEKVLSDYADLLRKAGVKGQFDQVSGDSPQATILKCCEDFECDAIVMGTRGLSGIKKLFLGSCSNYVLNHSPVPVSVVPLPDVCEEQKKK